jgi:hypothetical protein
MNNLLANPFPMLLHLFLLIEVALLGHSKGHLCHNGGVWLMEVRALAIITLLRSIPNVVEGMKSGGAGVDSG